MKEYKVIYQLQDGTVGYTYCNKGVRAKMKAIKELCEQTNNQVVAIDYIRLG